MNKTLNRPALLFAGLASVLALGCFYQATQLEQVAAASKVEAVAAAKAANSDCPDDCSPTGHDEECEDFGVNDVEEATAEDLEEFGDIIGSEEDA